jgi:acetyltransferase-like isoleucine patch superfamily enzyme
MLRIIFSFFISFLPLPIKLWIYRQLFGYKIGRNVRIGFSWLNVQFMEIGDNVQIGNLNRFKGLPFVRIGHDTVISNMNYFTSAPLFTDKENRIKKGINPSLEIGCHVGIGLGHYFDVQDAMTIGDFTTIAGLGSQFFTHQLDIKKGIQSAKPVHIGRYCMIGSGVKFCPGSEVGDCTVIAMGSVVVGQHLDDHVLIAGNPAVVKKILSPEYAYFTRSIGVIE